jgi:hypothetical protein
MRARERFANCDVYVGSHQLLLQGNDVNLVSQRGQPPASSMRRSESAARLSKNASAIQEVSCTTRTR